MPAEPEERMRALIRAAKKAHDDDTALLLLEKAKSLAPGNLEIYRLKAEIYERRGDDGGALREYRGALEVDPTDWNVKFAVLSLEYPQTKNLSLAGGIIRDLIWQKGLPAKLFNSSRGVDEKGAPVGPRSDSELGFDEALLADLAFAGRSGYGTRQLVAVEVARDGSGDVLVLDCMDAWLIRLTSAGALRFGVDLWVPDEERTVAHPTDIASAPDGTLIVADRRGNALRRFDGEGHYLSSIPVLAPLSIAAGPDGVVTVACEGASVLVRFGAKGKPLAPIELFEEGAEGGRPVRGVAAPEKGRVLAYDGAAVRAFGKLGEVLGTASIGAGAAAEAAAGGAAKKKRGQKAGPAKIGPPAFWNGIAADPSSGDVWIADAVAGRIVRLDAQGREVERVGGGRGGSAVKLRYPFDVAVDPASGALYIADTGNARVLARRPDGSIEALLSYPGWKGPGQKGE